MLEPWIGGGGQQGELACKLECCDTEHEDRVIHLAGRYEQLRMAEVFWSLCGILVSLVTPTLTIQLLKAVRLLMENHPIFDGRTAQLYIIPVI